MDRETYLAEWDASIERDFEKAASVIDANLHLSDADIIRLCLAKVQGKANPARIAEAIRARRSL